MLRLTSVRRFRCRTERSRTATSCATAARTGETASSATAWPQSRTPAQPQRSSNCLQRSDEIWLDMVSWLSAVSLQPERIPGNLRAQHESGCQLYPNQCASLCVIKQTQQTSLHPADAEMGVRHSGASRACTTRRQRRDRLCMARTWEFTASR